MNQTNESESARADREKTTETGFQKSGETPRRAALFGSDPTDEMIEAIMTDGFGKTI